MSVLGANSPFVQMVSRWSFPTNLENFGLLSKQIWKIPNLSFPTNLENFSPFPTNLEFPYFYLVICRETIIFVPIFNFNTNNMKTREEVIKIADDIWGWNEPEFHRVSSMDEVWIEESQHYNRWLYLERGLTIRTFQVKEFANLIGISEDELCISLCEDQIYFFWNEN